MNDQCTERGDLQGYSLGTLDRDEAAFVEQHLETCSTCRLTLNSLETVADELIVGLRNASIRTPGGDAPGDGAVSHDAASGALEQLQARLFQLGPPHWPTAAATDDGLELGVEDPPADRSRRERHWLSSEAPPETADELESCLLKSGLFTEDSLPAALEDAPPSARENAMSLARWLVERELLTRYQAAEFCLGRSRGLVLRGNAVLEEIGRGGMGRVYRGHNLRMGRPVAIKVMAPHSFQDSAAESRFHRETQAIAALSHPNVLTAFDAGRCEDSEYLVMEFVTGCDLGRVVTATGPMLWRRAVDCIRQAALGLSAAHDQGIIHRDVKPSNLMAFADGSVKVADLGLARFASTSESRSLTETGQVMGTIDYMSPEQAFDSARVDARSDIYSLGWTLYYLLTGERPYADAAGPGKVQLHRDGPIPSLVDLGLDVPEALDKCFQRMVAKLQDDRPSTMQEVVAELKALGPEPVLNEPVSTEQLPAGLWPERAPGDLDEFFADLARRVSEVPVSHVAKQGAASSNTFGRRIGWAVGGMATIVLVAAVALFATRPASIRGELAVAVEGGAPGDLNVLVVRNEEVVAELNAESGWRTTLAGGDYSLEFAAGEEAFQLQPRSFAISADRTSVRVEARPLPAAPPIAPPKKTRIATAEPIARPTEKAGKEDVEEPSPPAPEEKGGHENAKSKGKTDSDGLFGQIGEIQVTQRVNALTLSPDRKTVYVAGSDRIVHIVDVGKMKAGRRLVGHRAPIVHLAAAADGERLVTCGGDRTLRLWDLKSDQQRWVVHLPVTPYRVAFSPDGRSIAVASMVSSPMFRRPNIAPQHREVRSLMLLDAGNGDLIRSLKDGRDEFYWSLAFSPDGEVIAAGSKQGEVSLIDVSTGESIASWNDRPGPTYCLTFVDGGKRLYTGNALFIRCYSVPDGEVLYRYGLRSGVTGIDINSDESRVLAQGTIDVRLVETEAIGPEAVTRLHGHTSSLSGLRFLADERRAISGGWDGTIRFWKLPLKQP